MLTALVFSPYSPIFHRTWHLSRFRLRKIVGPLDDIYYDNPTGDYVFGPLSFAGKPPEQIYESVFDFGCGCGRNARQVQLDLHHKDGVSSNDNWRNIVIYCRACHNDKHGTVPKKRNL